MVELWNEKQEIVGFKNHMRKLTFLLLEMFRCHLVFDAKVVHFLLRLFGLGIRKLHTPFPLIDYMKQLELESKTKTTASTKSVKEPHNK